MSDPTRYTVAYICAIPIELIAASAFLDEQHNKPQQVNRHDQNEYVCGRIGVHNVVIASLPEGAYGNTSAAIASINLFRSFPNVRVFLLVGIGSGAPSDKHDIRLGDVVVSSATEQCPAVVVYDPGKFQAGQEILYDRFGSAPPPVVQMAISKLESEYMINGNQIDNQIKKVLTNLPGLGRYSRPPTASDRLYPSSITEGDPNDDQDRTIHRPDRDEAGPVIHYGPIAVGNMVMNNAKMRDRLAAQSGVLCFEMEGAGLTNAFPCLAIRGICDYADSHQTKEWQKYAAMAAAAYAKDLLLMLSPQQVSPENQLVHSLPQSLRITAAVDGETDDQASPNSSPTLSVFSEASSSSSASSLGQGSEPQLAAQLVTLLLRDSELRALYEDALRDLGIFVFATQHDNLLKRYFLDLKKQFKTPLLRQAIRLLRRVKERKDSTEWVIRIISPNVLGVEQLKKETAAGKREVSKHLQQASSTQTSTPALPPDRDAEDSELETSEAQESESDEESTKQAPPPKIETLELLAKGPPLAAYKARLRCLIKPPASIEEALATQNVDLLAALIEQCFEKVAVGDYAWISDLRDAGLRRREIAELLYASRYDKPWIFFLPNTDLFEFSSEVSEHRHLDGCPHFLIQESVGVPQRGNARLHAVSQKVKDLDVQRSIEELCGLGGISPTFRDRARWNGHVRFEKDNAAKISHSLTSPDSEEPKKVLDRLIKVSGSLLTAAGILQAAGLCCDSFTVFIETEKQTGCSPRVRLEKIYLAWLNRIYILCLNAHASNLTHDLTEDVRRLGIQSEMFLSQIFTSRSSIGKRRAKFEVRLELYLHSASLALQVLSIGLLSYLQAHVGSLRPFFLDYEICKALLLGLDRASDEPQSFDGHVMVRLRRITCLEGLFRDRVMVFALSAPSEDVDDGTRFDVLATPADLLDTWGPGQVIGRNDSSTQPTAIILGGGLIAPTRTMDNNGSVMYHWGHELSIPPDAPFMDMNHLITIGVLVHVNEQCPIRDRSSECWRRSLTCMVELGTEYDSWETAEMQFGVQGGYQLIFQGNWTQSKVQGTNIKQARLYKYPDDADLVDFLSCLWGVRVSYCTGVAQRVLLQHVAADLLPILAAKDTRADDVKMWKELQNTHSVLERLRNANSDAEQDDSLNKWLKTLPSNLHNFLLRAIRRLLCKIANTGLSSDRRYFSVAWLTAQNMSNCIRIPLQSGYAKWLPVLQDSGDCATFAYMSNACLEAGNIRCQGEDWRLELRIPLLATAVHCPKTTNAWTLTHGQSYFFRHMNRELFWVKAERDVTNRALPATLISLALTNGFPVQMANRVIELFRERSQRLCERKLALMQSGEAAVVLSKRYEEGQV